MKSRAFRIAAAFLLMGAIGWGLSTDAGRRWAEGALDGISASVAERYKIEVVLVYEDDRSFSFSRAISRREYQDAGFLVDELYDKYVREAKTRLSKKLHYFEQLHGDDEALKIARVKVRSVKVVDTMTDRETSLRRG